MVTIPSAPGPAPGSRPPSPAPRRSAAPGRCGRAGWCCATSTKSTSTSSTFAGEGREAGRACSRRRPRRPVTSSTGSVASSTAWVSLNMASGGPPYSMQRALGDLGVRLGLVEGDPAELGLAADQRDQQRERRPTGGRARRRRDPGSGRGPASERVGRRHLLAVDRAPLEDRDQQRDHQRQLVAEDQLHVARRADRAERIARGGAAEDRPRGWGSRAGRRRPRGRRARRRAGRARRARRAWRRASRRRSATKGSARKPAVHAGSGTTTSLPSSLTTSQNGWPGGGPWRHCTSAVTLRSTHDSASPSATANSAPGKTR